MARTQESKVLPFTSSFALRAMACPPAFIGTIWYPPLVSVTLCVAGETPRSFILSDSKALRAPSKVSHGPSFLPVFFSIGLYSTLSSSGASLPATNLAPLG